jgi:hypothetical protein
MIASKHNGLHQAGIRLQKQWKSKVYRKEVDVFWREHETIRISQTTITQSVQLHQARILQHSYKDFCNTLERREGMILFAIVINSNVIDINMCLTLLNNNYNREL